MAVDKDILKELREMNSVLAGLSRDMPFEVPAGYFNNLPGSVLLRATEKVSLKEKTMPHLVPEGYFDNLPAELIRSLKDKKTKTGTVPVPGKRINLWAGMRWAVAAMLMLAIGLGSYRFLVPRTQTVEQQLQALSDEAIVSYVEDNIYAFETETIANHVGTTDMNSSSLNLNDKAIENYLEEAGWQ